MRSSLEQLLVVLLDTIIVFLACAIIGHWLLQLLIKEGYFVLNLGY